LPNEKIHNMRKECRSIDRANSASKSTHDHQYRSRRQLKHFAIWV